MASERRFRYRLPMLGANDLLYERVYRRLWSSILLSAFAAQILMLGLPLTAAVLLQATPRQMGMLTAMELAPFMLFSLPSGVWLDRMRKLPVYIGGELLAGVAAFSVPLASWLGMLSMHWLYVVGFVLGTVHTVSGTAAQIVLMQIVPRERLVEAHARNSLATSMAEVAGPGLAGVLIKLVSAPLALLINSVLLVSSALILRGVRVVEGPHQKGADFWRSLVTGLRFVLREPLLARLALIMGGWQLCQYSAQVVQILFATRELGMGERDVGFCYVGLGVGTVFASSVGNRVSAWLGPGRTMVLGLVICAVGWLCAAMAPANAWGRAAFALMLFCFGLGAVLAFINFLAIRQALTPATLLGRMTASMRWLTLLAAAPGALFGGWLGEHLGLRSALAFASATSLLVAFLAWRQPLIREMRRLPATSTIAE